MSKTVKKEVINNILVSTVKLPINHGTEDEPLWYETMLFPVDEYDEVTDWMERDMARYATEEEAIEGHNKFISKVLAGEYDE